MGGAPAPTASPGYTCASLTVYMLRAYNNNCLK